MTTLTHCGGFVPICGSLTAEEAKAVKEWWAAAHDFPSYRERLENGDCDE